MHLRTAHTLRHFQTCIYPEDLHTVHAQLMSHEASTKEDSYDVRNQQYRLKFSATQSPGYRRHAHVLPRSRFRKAHHGFVIQLQKSAKMNQ
jgi:hypothetical protein